MARLLVAGAVITGMDINLSRPNIINKYGGKPHNRDRVPDLYELVVIEDNCLRWTGIRFDAKSLAEVRRTIEPPTMIVPITFADRIRDK
jgi:hypothetical protein